MTTYWHLCNPEAHKTNCATTLTLTTDRPKISAGKLLIEFHPPYGRDEDGGSQQVSTDTALGWPHVISYS